MEFDVKKTVEDIIKFIRDYFNINHLKGVVVGISGGKDSSVVASLFVKALGHENVLGLWLPANSLESDKEDAIKLCKKLNIELKEFDLNDIYNLYVQNIKDTNNVLDEYLIDANINLKPRLRMLSLYYFAAMQSKLTKAPYIVAGTSNKCERYVGYFTKGGDNVCDISVLGNLLVSEVIKIGDYLEVPYEICHKIPDDGLSNLSDEEKLGVKYADIEKYIKEQETGIHENLSDDVRARIKKLHDSNFHKFYVPTFGSKE